MTPAGKLKLINGEKELEVEGNTVLTTLSDAGIFLPSAGGGGTCIQCTCQVHKGEEVYCLQKSHIFQESK